MGKMSKCIETALKQQKSFDEMKQNNALKQQNEKLSLK